MNEDERSNYIADVDKHFNQLDAIEQRRIKEHNQLYNDNTFLSWLGADDDQRRNWFYPGYEESYIEIIQKIYDTYKYMILELNKESCFSVQLFSLKNRFKALRQLSADIEHYEWENFQDLSYEFDSIIFRLTEVFFVRLGELLEVSN